MNWQPFMNKVDSTPNKRRRTKAQISETHSSLPSGLFSDKSFNPEKHQKGVFRCSMDTIAGTKLPKINMIKQKKYELHIHFT